MSGGVLGVMTGASLAVSVIGQSMVQARGVLSRHAINQVDPLLSNRGVEVWMPIRFKTRPSKPPRHKRRGQPPLRPIFARGATAGKVGCSHRLRWKKANVGYAWE